MNGLGFVVAFGTGYIAGLGTFWVVRAAARHTDETAERWSADMGSVAWMTKNDRTMMRPAKTLIAVACCLIVASVVMFFAGYGVAAGVLDALALMVSLTILPIASFCARAK